MHCLWLKIMKCAPSVAARKDCPAINAWMASIGPIRQFLASGLGGILIATGILHTFLAGALALLIAGIWIGPWNRWPLIGKSSTKPAPALGEGFRFVVRDPVLCRMTLFSAAFNLGLSFYIGEYLLYLRNVLALSPQLIGLSLGLGTIGTLAALLLSPWALGNKLIETIIIAAMLVAAGIGVAGLAHNWPAFTLGAVLLEAGSASITQSLILVRQHVVPLEVMGSVFIYTVHTDIWTSCALVSLSVTLAVPYARSARSSILHDPKGPI